MFTLHYFPRWDKGCERTLELDYNMETAERKALDILRDQHSVPSPFGCLGYLSLDYLSQLYLMRLFFVDDNDDLSYIRVLNGDGYDLRVDYDERCAPRDDTGPIRG